MNSLAKNRKLINVIFVVGLVLDTLINIVINKISDSAFNIFAQHNIWTFAIFILLIVMYVICQVIIRNSTAKGQRRQLQKAFKDNGGYDTVVNEMKLCIENHDFKSIRELKKVVNFIER